MQLVNFTHFDLDGVVSHILLKNIFPNIIVQSTGYVNMEKNAHKLMVNFANEKVGLIITDLVIDEKLMERFLKRYERRVVLIDHHQQSLSYYKDNEKSILPEEDYTLNGNGSGALGVLWRYKSQLEKLPNWKKLEKLAIYAHFYDSWSTGDKKRFNMGYILNELFWYLGWDEFILRFGNGFDAFSDKEVEIAKARAMDKREIVELAIKVAFPEDNPICLYIIPQVEKADYITNDICFCGPDYVLYFIVLPGADKISIRVRMNEKVSGWNINIMDAMTNVMKKHGLEHLKFGGHPFAGGFETTGISNEEILSIINDIYEDIFISNNL